MTASIMSTEILRGINGDRKRTADTLPQDASPPDSMTRLYSGVPQLPSLYSSNPPPAYAIIDSRGHSRSLATTQSVGL